LHNRHDWFNFSDFKAQIGRWIGYDLPRSKPGCTRQSWQSGPLMHEGSLAMRRQWLFFIGMVAATTAVACGGCRSCSTCHDYDPPVANCDCNACGSHRAGSASGGYMGEEYASEEYVVEPPMGEPSSQDPANPSTQPADEVQQPIDTP
jgi:hypothetical protein